MARAGLPSTLGAVWGPLVNNSQCVWSPGCHRNAPVGQHTLVSNAWLALRQILFK